MKLIWSERHRTGWWLSQLWFRLPDGTKPLPEPILTQICHGITRPQRVKDFFYVCWPQIIWKTEIWTAYDKYSNPDSKVDGANMGPIWGRQDPGGPHVGPINLAIWEAYLVLITLWDSSQFIGNTTSTHWGWDKQGNILQTTFFKCDFFSMKIIVLWLKFHWICSQGPNWYPRHWFR